MKRLITLFALMMITSTASANAFASLLGYSKILDQDTMHFLTNDEFELLNVNSILGSPGSSPTGDTAVFTIYTFYSSKNSKIIECATMFGNKEEKCMPREFK